MKLATWILGLFVCATLLANSNLVPSSKLKAFKGPEGEVIAMVEVNSSKEMLVHFKNLGTELDGKTGLYQIADMGKGKKDIYVEKKKGSKTYRSVLLTQRDGSWEFYHPGKPGTEFHISYSEQESEKFKLEEVLKSYNPQTGEAK